jgi:hypothetical protein
MLPADAPNNFGASAGNILALPNATVPAGGYYLIQLASNAANGITLPTPDLTGTLNLSSTEGKVALASITTSLGCGAMATPCPTTNLVDMVGYGAAANVSAYEGTGPAGTLSATASAVRKGAGCVDTDDNSGDFDVVTPAGAPRNSAVAPTSCTANDGGASDAAVDSAPTDAGPSDTGPSDADVDADDGSADAEPVDSGTDTGAPDSGPGTTGGDGLVISQVYGGGGNNGAAIDRDFIEIFNRSSKAVQLDGLSLQYGGATRDFGSLLPDGGPSTDILALPSMTVDPGKYVLVGLSSTNLDAGTALPTVDVDGNLALGATNGKVALVRGTDGPGCGGATRCTGSTLIVDMVGYGTASDYEGSAATAALSNTNGALRKGDGCTDTNDNAADFDVAAPAPRSSATAVHKCGITPPPPPPDDAGDDTDSGEPDDSGSTSPTDSGKSDAHAKDSGSNASSGSSSSSSSGCSISSGTTAANETAGASALLVVLGAFFARRIKRDRRSSRP